MYPKAREELYIPLAPIEILKNIWHLNLNTHFHIFDFWCVVLCHLLPATPPPPVLTTATKPTNQQSNQQSNQQQIIKILYPILSSYILLFISPSIILEHRITDLSWPEDCCCFPMYHPSRLRWAADKWGTNPCCCGSRTGTCGHNHRTSQHAHLSDVARKMWSGRSGQESGRSCRQKVVQKKCVKTKIVLIVEVNCTDKKTTEQ